MAYKVLIPETVAPEGIEHLKELGYEVKMGRGISKDVILEDIKDCDAVIIRVAVIDREIIESSPRLKVIAKHGAGYDSIDIKAAADNHVRVVFAPYANSLSVAEHTMALVLACAKKIPFMAKQYREGNYKAKDLYPNTELAGKTLGLIGLGRIGMMTAQIAMNGFGMRAVAYDPFIPKDRDLKGVESDYADALKFLSECLRISEGERTVILIDEYDVPLENAYFAGFYEEMTGIIRSLLESALKTNDSLAFAVVTGCLRISRESIFTGLNNLEINSITTALYGENFGFIQSEVEALLDFYGLKENMDTVQQWYDGYRFGNAEVYNPWSVISYVKSCCGDRRALPRPYWSNTSSNSIVRSLVERADLSVKQEIEALIEGRTITKPIHEDITYEDIDSTQDNLWNFLFFTGYLKKISEYQDGENIYIEMAIPNREVRYIYKTTVLRWFEEKTDEKELTPLYESILEGDADRMARILSENLMETISFYDYQESYYHGFLAGMLKNIGSYIVLSNRESGNGRPDILLKYPSVRGKAVILEIKVANTFSGLEEKCDEALRQIEEQRYEEPLRQEGYQDILKYGVAFYRKECMVKKAEE